MSQARTVTRVKELHQVELEPGEHERAQITWIKYVEVGAAIQFTFYIE